MSSFFTGGGGSSSSETTPDSLASQLAQLYFGNVSDLDASSGGLGTFGGSQPGLFTQGTSPYRDEAGFSRLIQDQAANPRDYEPFLRDLGGMSRDYNTFASGLTRQAGQSVATPSDTFSMNTLQQIMSDPQAMVALQAQLRGAQGGPSGLEQQGLQTLQGRTDPSAMLTSLQEYMQKIGGPEAAAASQAGGMGGYKGGAFGEGLARESARLALPISQLVNQNQGEYANAQLGIGGRLQDRQTSLTQLIESLQQGRAGNARDLFGMGSNLESRGLARNQLAAGAMRGGGEMAGAFQQIAQMLDAQRMQQYATGQQSAANPRLLELQDFLRRQDISMSTLLGIPVNTGSRSSGTSSQNLTLGGLTSNLGTVAGGAGLLLNGLGSFFN